MRMKGFLLGAEDKGAQGAFIGIAHVFVRRVGHGLGCMPTVARRSAHHVDLMDIDLACRHLARRQPCAVPRRLIVLLPVPIERVLECLETHDTHTWVHPFNARHTFARIR